MHTYPDNLTFINAKYIASLMHINIGISRALLNSRPGMQFKTQSFANEIIYHLYPTHSVSHRICFFLCICRSRSRLRSMDWRMRRERCLQSFITLGSQGSSLRSSRNRSRRLWVQPRHSRRLGIWRDMSSSRTWTKYWRRLKSRRSRRRSERMGHWMPYTRSWHSKTSEI